jgi:hypothetical protein
MARTSPENDHPPIYEELVRERGDAVAEAQRAAAHTQTQAAELLTDGEPPRWDQPTGHHRDPHFG